MSPLQLDPDRALPFPAEQRNIAREIYGETKDLPLICMHGHVEPEAFANDVPFADPAQLLIVPETDFRKSGVRSALASTTPRD